MVYLFFYSFLLYVIIDYIIIYKILDKIIFLNSSGSKIDNMTRDSPTKPRIKEFIIKCKSKNFLRALIIFFSSYFTIYFLNVFLFSSFFNKTFIPIKVFRQNNRYYKYFPRQI